MPGRISPGHFSFLLPSAGSLSHFGGMPADVAHFIQANTDGRLHDARDAAVSPLDRGFLYGDAIYEVWRTYGRAVFAWEDHWARLRRSAAALYFPELAEETVYRREIGRTAAAFRATAGWAGDLYLRLQVTRGGGEIGLDTALADKVSNIILVKPVPVMSERATREGLILSIAKNLRRNARESLNPAWKTGNYLNNILCLREARARGADEVVITNLAGEVTEAAVSNIAFVREGAILMPPLSAGILEGITRQRLIDHVAPAAGVAVREATVRPEDLSGMEECFLLSTTKDVQPVGAIDGLRFAVGAGTVTARLQDAFAHHAAEASAAANAWRV